jgi:hypothetical protein
MKILHKIVEMPRDTNDLVDAMNKLSAEGWAFVEWVDTEWMPPNGRAVYALTRRALFRKETRQWEDVELAHYKREAYS